jgi:hypothetical protein
VNNHRVATRPVSNALTSAEAIATERYSECGILRSCIAAIPIIGGPLDALVGTRGQNITQRRLEATISALSSVFLDAQQTNVDREYLESEDFFDLMNRVFRASLRTRHDEKRLLFAKIVKHSVLNQVFRHEAELYLKIIDELSPEEFRLASILHAHPPSSPSFADWDPVEYRKLLDERQVVGRHLFREELLSRLEAKGVIRKRTRASRAGLRSFLHTGLEMERDGSAGPGFMNVESVSIPFITEFFEKCLETLESASNENTDETDSIA